MDNHLYREPLCAIVPVRDMLRCREISEFIANVKEIF